MSVCLTMIVKNEEHVLGKCLESVRPFIDHWVIADTGSIDHTEDVIRDKLSGIPGELHRIPWEGFGKARTAALRAAEGKADYTLVIDADETLDAPNGLGELTEGAYLMWAKNKHAKFITRRLFKMDRVWQYNGVLHEYPTADVEWVDGKLDDVSLWTSQDGQRSKDPNKYKRDAIILEMALIDEPLNSRYVYYLAQSYRDGGDHEQAAYRYLQRAGMGPGLNYEEVYCSLLEAGRCFGRIGRLDQCEESLLRARRAAPDRPEAMASLRDLYKALAKTIPPSGTMNVETCHYEPEG